MQTKQQSVEYKKTTFAAISAIVAVLALAATNTVKLVVKLVFASSFTPKTLSSGLQGTGEHGVQKIFSPGQEALTSGGTTSSFSPGHEKP
jgi:hypothetical protein